MEETKIIYHIDDEETPYLVKIPKAPEKVTLGDFKNVLNRPNYKFFFKSMDDDFGVVKEEIVDDDAPLPAFNQRVVSWIVSADTSVADSLSQCGEDGPPRHQAYHSSGGESVGGGGGGGALDDTTCTETESIISNRRDRVHMRPPRLPKFDKAQERPFADRRLNGHGGTGPGGRGYESSSMISSDLETTSFFDSDDDASSRITATTTGSSSVSQIHARNRRRKRRHHHGAAGAGGLGGAAHRHHHPHHMGQALSHASSISSITDSTMSLNIITVTLNMDAVNFLGISIVGQSSKGGDGGIYVGSIMKGGAVALDGRIEPGDMILQVNDINFENMSNDGAVRVLRDVVQNPGPIKLVVAKCWDPHPPKGYFTVPRTEPVHPIDPGAWVAHTQACRAMTVDDYPGRPPSATTLSSHTSSFVSSVAETERPYEEMKLTLASPMTSVVRAMAAPDSGLEIRDRMWLKITIPNAFIGNEVVDWLYQRLEGFADRKEARKYSAQLLKAGLIKHTVNKREFSEQCYYVFGDICDSLAGLKLSCEEDSISELGPLPPPSTTSPWGSNLGSTAPHLAYQGGTFTPVASTIAVGGYVQPQQPPTFNYTNESYMFNRDSGSGGSSSGTQKKANHHKSPLQSGGSDSEAGSQVTAPGHRAPLPPTSVHQQQMHMHHHQQQQLALQQQQQHFQQQQQPLPPPPIAHQPLPPIPSCSPSLQQPPYGSSSSPLVPPTNGSCGGSSAGGGGGSSGSERSSGAAGRPQAGLNADMAASTASFNIAMTNPCNYFVDSV